MHVLLLILEFLAIWTALSIACAIWLAIAGLRISRRQESQTFASDSPLVYYEMGPSEYRRLN